jgi:arsenate reductase-like glutaredoxin family protein
MTVLKQFYSFSDAQKRVEEMERERRKLDRQLDQAQEKTKRANLGQEVLEAKILVNRCSSE